MKNIIFDLGGVLFARDINKCTQDFYDFFSFIRTNPMPKFWVEYDRGTSTMAEVIDHLTEINHCDRSKSERYLHQSIEMQETVDATEQLVHDLKVVDYKLYVLSNMSHEFIAFLRKFPVYDLFDGEVISCEVGVVKPEPEIYRILLDRYKLDPAESFFIDDRRANIAAAAELGIDGYHFNHTDPVESCEFLRRKFLSK